MDKLNKNKAKMNIQIAYVSYTKMNSSNNQMAKKTSEHMKEEKV